ncbi:MAG: hypothetical protein OXG97_03125 [Candidatus Poribacteria bacterium]|nr:hypothetical protein [Candidatus Poribacteria bacterium]
MRHKPLYIYCILSVVLLCPDFYPALAKAPITAKIVFASGRDGNREIYLMNPDGTQQVNISRNKADDVAPIWSPTGEQILFASDRDRFLGSWDLYLMDPDGKNVRSVFEKSADRRHPVWSFDGRHIAYTKIEQGEWFVYIATMDGREEEEVAIGSLSDWSPDGAEITFLSGAFDEPRRISLLKVRSRKQTFLPFPKVPMWVRSPVWSPNGEKIAFAWRPEGFEVETIYIMNRDGTEVQQIVAPQGSSAGEPAWSPVGNALLYIHADDGDDTQIFKIDLESNETIQLTHIGTGHHLGSWFDPAFALPVSPQSRLLTTTWSEVKRK